MGTQEHGAIWFASYPKSGNTWLRFLLGAYRRGGKLDINDVRGFSSDGNATTIRAVSPIPLRDLGVNGQLLLRPAAVLNLLAHMTGHKWVKTHFVNVQPPGMPSCIPKEFTKKAVYVVRDPRSVVLSMAKYFGYPIDKAVEAMNNKDFRLGNDDLFACQLVSSWSNHVASWVSEKNFDVHIVRYEDMLEDAGKELTEVLEFLDEDVDPAIVELAVEATELSRLQKKEQEHGYLENSGPSNFFNEGGIRWQNELGPRWIKQIEEDHGEIMRHMGYLDAAVTEIRSVK